MKKLRIGAVVNTAFKPSREVLRGIERQIVNRSPAYPNLTLRYFLGSAATTSENLAAFAISGIDVMIFCGIRRETVFKFIKDSPDHPPVVIATYSPFSEDEWALLGNGGAVMLDNAAIGREAAEYFLTHGMRNYAFLGPRGDREDVSGNIRLATFHSTLAKKLESNMTFEQFLVGTLSRNDDFWEDANSDIERWIAALPYPCGIFVNGENLASRVARHCRRAGIKIPGQIEILGVDGRFGAEEVMLDAVTSIVPGYSEVAATAVDMAIDIASGEQKVAVGPDGRRFAVVSECTIKERLSTSSSRGYGNVASRAKEFIKANAKEGISVLDVARGLGVSRRTLEVRVRESLGTTVHALISEERMNNICELLKNTNMRISEIVIKSGYSLTTNAFVLFKRTYGMTMRDYRRQFKK